MTKQLQRRLQAPPSTHASSASEQETGRWVSSVHRTPLTPRKLLQKPTRHVAQAVKQEWSQAKKCTGMAHGSQPACVEPYRQESTKDYEHPYT